MGRGRALPLVLAAAFAFLLSVPAASEEACIDPEDLPLIYNPDEPPVCPTPMLELVPSTIGRPTDYSAIDLAACAGMMDAVVLVYGEAYVTQEVDGEEYFAAAVARPERPTLEVLEQWRRSSREEWTASLKEPEQISGSFEHAAGQCSGVWYN